MQRVSGYVKNFSRSINLMCFYLMTCVIFILSSPDLFAGKGSQPVASEHSSSDHERKSPSSRFYFLKTIAPTIEEWELRTIKASALNPLSPAASCYLEIKNTECEYV